MAKKQPSAEVRKLENGDFCVDLGRKWFRVRNYSEVETVLTVDAPGESYSTTERRAATPEEREFAIRAVLLRD